MYDMKEEFNIEIKIIRKYAIEISEMKSLINQIKILVESLISRMDQ
jgi:hypothetical protein